MAEILVIKLGALGDFVLAMGPCKAIRDHHPGDRITLLTTRPYVDLARRTGYFDQVLIDQKPGKLEWLKWLDLRGVLRSGNFSRVYDLQTSGRSGRYFRLFGKPKPEWSGIVKGCSHRHDTPHRTKTHTIERQREQLAVAGIDNVPMPDLSWAAGPHHDFDLPDRFALFVPGGAPTRPAKRWSPGKYVKLAWKLKRKGIIPVLLGGAAELLIMEAITEGAPFCVNLANKTGFEDIAWLAGKAELAVGNDTGPMHIVTLANCPSVVLYSNDSDPTLCGQKGEKVTYLKEENIQSIAPEEVMDALATLTHV